MTSWKYIKSQIISSDIPLYNNQVEYHIHIGSGNSTNNTLYIPNDQINNDFSDIRFRVNKLFMPYTSITISPTYKIFYVLIPLINEETIINILHGRSTEKTWESAYDTYSYYDEIQDANRIELVSGTTYMDYTNNQLSIIGNPSGLAHTKQSFSLQNKVIDIYAAISNNLNNSIQLISSGHIISFRRNINNSIITEYDLDQSSNITVSTSITKFTLTTLSNTLIYSINDNQVYTHSIHQSFESVIRFSPESDGTIIINKIIIKENNQINYGEWTFYDQSNYFILPYDQQCYNMELPYNEFPTNMMIDYTSFNTYATTTLNTEQFMYFDGFSIITLNGEYTYVHKSPSSITAWILPNTDPYPFTLLDTTKYTINITPDKKLNLVLRDDSNNILSNITSQTAFEPFNWSFFAIVHDFPSITIYTYTLNTELLQSSTSYSGTPPSTQCTTITLGASSNNYNKYTGLLNALSIENTALTSEEILNISCFATIILEPDIPPFEE